MPTFTNQAQLTYARGTVLSNVVTGEITDTLSLTKTALTADYAPGDTVTYLVYLTNTAAADAAGLTVTDDLGAYDLGTLTGLVPLTYVPGSLRYFQNGVPQPLPTVTEGPPLTVTGVTVPAQGNALLIYRTALSAYAPMAAGATVTNTAAVRGAGAEASDTETVAVTAAPRLEITKSMTPMTVADGDTVTFTFTVTNYAPVPAEADQNIVITDTFDPPLADLRVVYNGVTPWGEGTLYTYPAPDTGVFATGAGQITVPAATVTQDPATGVVTVVPGTTTLSVTGTV